MISRIMLFISVLLMALLPRIAAAETCSTLTKVELSETYSLFKDYTEWGSRDRDARRHNRGFPEECGDLRGLRLGVRELTKLKLRHYDLSDTYFDGTLFSLMTSDPRIPADLTGSRFDRATMLNGVLIGCHMAGTSFAGARLQRVTATLPTTDLTGADFSRAKLFDDFFNKARLAGARFAGARIERTQFYGTDLSGADFSHVRLRKVSFEDADLSGADVRGTDLIDTSFEAARSLVGAIYDDTTFLPFSEDTAQARGMIRQ